VTAIARLQLGLNPFPNVGIVKNMKRESNEVRLLMTSTTSCGWWDFSQENFWQGFTILFLTSISASSLVMIMNLQQ
jgi:hypothetical protein